MGKFFLYGLAIGGLILSALLIYWSMKISLWLAIFTWFVCSCTWHKLVLDL